MKLPVLTLLLAWASCLWAQDEYLDNALLVEKYLQSVSRSDGNGLSWPVMPEKDTLYDLSLYSGTPGVILFYLELYHASGEEYHLEIIKNGADFLLSQEKPQSIPPYQLGLYTGAAGMAFTLEKVYEATHDKKYHNRAFEWLKAIHDTEGMKKEENFGGYTDIVYGASGIGLTALYFLEKYQDEWLKNLFGICAEYVYTNSVKSGSSVRWKMSPQVPYFMDNFSHGTAGNAYFMLKAHSYSGDDRFLTVGVKAAQYLLDAADDNGMVCHHDPGGEELKYLSWCHGPPGTSRLFFLMSKISNLPDWRNVIEVNMKSLADMELHVNQTPGYWNNEGWCCGTVGIALYLSHPLLNDENHYAEDVYSLEQKIYTKATLDPNGMRWSHAENRRSPDEVAVQTGLMQGSAGFGLYYVRRYLEINGKKWQIVLPDEIGN